MIPESFEKLEGVIIPAEFWPAFQYEGTADYVAVYWEPSGDEASYMDGRMEMVGAYWPVYTQVVDGLAYRGLLPYPKLETLGSSEETATHVLVIHRPTGQAYYAERYEAGRFLMSQWVENDPTLSSIMEAAAMDEDQVLEAMVQNTDFFDTGDLETLLAFMEPVELVNLDGEEWNRRIAAHHEAVAAFQQVWEVYLNKWPALEMTAELLDLVDKEDDQVMSFDQWMTKLLEKRNAGQTI